MSERPSTAECALCKKEFQCKKRSQGGGRRAIYCSPACRSLDWVRGNAGKRKASVLKYESDPGVKVRKRLLQRKRRLAKYGLDEAALQHHLNRQNNVCYGCLETFDDENVPCIDHHQTGAVRGLLCSACNIAIGYVKERPDTLRRLMAYLEYDKSKLRVYIIGALKNTRIPEIGNRLRAEGYDVMDEWYTPGPAADENWQAYEKLRGRTYAEALRGRAATNIFLFDRVYLDLSDVVVLVMPAGKSAMIEMGYAKGQGKRGYLFLDGQEPERYDIMPGFVDKVLATEGDLVAELRQDHARLVR